MPSAKQLSLGLKPKFRHGGARPGAGRPRNKDRMPHSSRPSFLPRHALHVTLRLAEGMPSFRGRDGYRCLREAVTRARKQGLAIVHFAIQGNHLHLILDPTADLRLARQMQSLCIAFAKRLNGILSRKGAVFADRYHVRVLKTPTEARNAIAYVLTNDSHHRGHGKTQVTLDPFSSAWAFRGWRELLGRKPEFRVSAWPEQTIEARLDAMLTEPRGWLLREGWKRAS